MQATTQSKADEVRELAKRAPVELMLSGVHKRRKAEIAGMLGPDGVQALHRLFLAYNRSLSDGFALFILRGGSDHAPDELHMQPFSLLQKENV